MINWLHLNGSQNTILPTARWGHACVSIGNCVIIIGGFSSKPFIR